MKTASELSNIRISRRQFLAATAVIGASPYISWPAWAAGPHSFKQGDFEISVLSDGELTLPLSVLAPEAPAFTEQQRYEPNSPYSASKAASDHFVRAWHHTFGLPTLIVTLGTLSIFRGFMLTFIGQKQITTLPPGMREFARMMLIRGENADGSFYNLHGAFLVTVLVVVLTWFLLQRTMLGRQIYAIGGSVESARRIGINVRGVQFFIYVYVGVLAGLAGVIHASMARVANPFDLVGLELSVIAAVVLGGARLAGGHGTLTGTILGVALIVLVRNSLVVLGIPATWQSVTIGLLILLGTGLPAWQAKRAAARAA